MRYTNLLLTYLLTRQARHVARKAALGNCPQPNILCDKFLLTSFATNMYHRMSNGVKKTKNFLLAPRRSQVRNIIFVPHSQNGGTAPCGLREP